VIVVSFLEAPAVVSGLDDVAVVGQSIEQRGRHLGVAEHTRPFTKGEISGTPLSSHDPPRHRSPRPPAPTSGGDFTEPAFAGKGGANFSFEEPEPEYGPVPFCRHNACTIR
jgi:hypothetical protein